MSVLPVEVVEVTFLLIKMFHVDLYKVQYPTTLLTTVTYKFSNMLSFKDVCLFAESTCYFPIIEPNPRKTFVLYYSWKCIRFFEIKASIILTNTCHLVLCLRKQHSIKLSSLTVFLFLVFSSSSVKKHHPLHVLQNHISSVPRLFYGQFSFFIWNVLLQISLSAIGFEPHHY